MSIKPRIDEIDQDQLRKWIALEVATQSHRLSQGYQGYTFLYAKNGHRWVVKAPLGWGPARWIRRWMLHNEYKAYAALKHVDGVPKCYGFIDGSYLILEHVDGLSIRDATITDPAEFYNALFGCIERLHMRGVAHGDLKKKDNILVVKNRYPVLIDFGVAIVRKDGRAPVNHYLYRLLKQFDYNAWIKHKYDRKLDLVREEDRCYLKRTGIEYIAGWIKGVYRKCKRYLRHS